MGYAENDTVEIMMTNLREVCISLNLTKGLKGGVQIRVVYRSGCVNPVIDS